MHRLPPLNALRAFEAAARHLSFTKAAEELHVTPAAVSQQVKLLEEYAGSQIVRFEVRDAAGRATWSSTLSEHELRQRLDYDVVWFMVPAESLPAGRLTLIVSRGPGDPLEVVFETVFLVTRGE